MYTIKIAAEKRAIGIGADFNFYTDGLTDGGAGVVFTRGNPTFSKVVKTIRRRGAASLVPIKKKKRGPWRNRHTAYKRVCRKIIQCSWIPDLNMPLCLESLQV